MMKKYFLILCAFALVLTSCKDDEDDNPVNPTPEGPASFTVTVENVDMAHTFFQGGVANTPTGADMPGPLLPGDSYEISFHAPNHILPMGESPKLSFVTMFVQSNDLFFAPDQDGIDLYDEDSNPIGELFPADVTDQVLLWDAGTEVNEVTGGPNQKPQQDATAGEVNATDVGEDENGLVTLISNNTDGVNTLPDVSDVIHVSVSYTGDNTFDVVFENVSNSMTIAIPYSDPNDRGPVPISPLVWGVHTASAPFFSSGAEASEGVEDIAEDGEAGTSGMFVSDNTGVVVPLSPGAWAVHGAGVKPLFESGQPDFGEGLEAIAEDGKPIDLAGALAEKSAVSASGFFDTAVGASEPGAIGPGGSFTFSFDAEPGDRLSMATMFVQSNDWFYSFPDGGITLFNGSTANTGDVTSSLSLYDAGTEVDQYPGSGSDQVIRQSSQNTGAPDDDNSVRIVSDAPSVVSTDPADVIKVTISAQ